MVTKIAKVSPASFPASELKLEIDVTFDFDPADTGVYQCSVCNLWRGVEVFDCPACRGRRRAHTKDQRCRHGACLCPAPAPFDPERSAPEVEVMHDEPIPVPAVVVREPTEGAEQSGAQAPATPVIGPDPEPDEHVMPFGDISTIPSPASTASAARYADPRLRLLTISSPAW